MPPPQAVRRRTTVTRAPRSRARLIPATNSRRFVAKPRTPHPIPQAAQLFEPQSRNVAGSRGKTPRPFSRGLQRGILSFEKESIPLYPCSAMRCTSPRHQCRSFLCTCAKKRKKETKSPPPGSARASCCVVCVFLGGRKSHRGEFPFASIKIPVNLG